MEILSPGKKIKKIRKEFRIKQKDITGGEITRELISIIENDKCGLTPKVAQIIADNITSICHARNINYTLNANFLLEDVTMQANKVADTFITSLSNEDSLNPNTFSDLVNEIEDFLVKYDLKSKKLIIFNLIGDYYKKLKQYWKSYTYYIKSLENIDYDDTYHKTNLAIKICQSLLMLNNYEEAEYYSELSMESLETIDDTHKYLAIYNAILINMHYNNYDEVLNYIKLAEKKISKFSKEHQFEISCVKAHCLREKELFADTIEVNKSILLSLDKKSVGKHLLILSNILDVYTVLKDKANSQKYIDYLLPYVENFHSNDEIMYFSRAYYQIALSAELVDDVALAREYYEKAIDNSKHTKNNDILELSLEKLFALIVAKYDECALNNFKNKVLELISSGTINSSNNIVLNIIYYYNSIGKYDEISCLIEFITEKTNVNLHLH